MADIDPSGIASAEAWGTPTIAVLQPSAIASAEAWGTPGLSAVLAVRSGIASSEAWGKPSILLVDASTLFINGVQFVWRESTFHIRKQTSAQWAASFEVVHYSGALPNPNQEVVFFWQGVKRFAGLIASVEEVAIPSMFGPSVLRINCTGYTGYTDRAIVAKLYTVPIGELPRIIIYDIWLEHLAQFGITVTGEPGSSVAIGEQLFHYITVTEAFNRIRDACPGWDWWITDDKELIWQQGGAGPAAPFTLRNVDVNVDMMSVTRSAGRFRNKQWVLPSSNVLALRTDTATGDGTTIAFATLYAVPKKPIVRVNGVNQKVVAFGSFTAGWKFYYIPNSIGVFAATAPAAAAAIEILYPNPFPIAVSAQDDASIAAVGLYEAVYQAKNVTTYDAALAMAQGLLDAFETSGAFPQTLVFTYNSKLQPGWLVPGNVLDIDRTFPTALGNYIVEQVDSQEEADTIWRHTVTCRYGKGEVTDAQLLAQFQTSARVSINSPPLRATALLFQDIPGTTNPGASVGLVAARYVVPAIPGGGSVGVASWDAFFPTDPPTGADFVGDILLNGTTIFPAGNANKIVVPDGETAIVSGIRFVSDNIRLVEGDVLTFNVIQVGSTNKGKNAVFHLNFIV